MNEEPAGKREPGAHEAQLRELAQENARLAEELALARSDAARYRAILASATDYAIFTLDPSGRVTSWNAGAERLMGWREAEAIGMNGRLLFTPEDRECGAAEAEIALASRAGRAGNERWHLRKDGSRFWGSGLLLTLSEGHEPGFLKIMRDRTERREADERQTLLLSELSHRVKNSLAVVLSVARQSGNRAADLSSFLSDFEGRVGALAAAHDLLSRHGWLSAALPELVASALGSRGDDRIEVRVADLALQPAAAQSLVLALHELTTNALKHGSLVRPEGRVELDIAPKEKDLSIIWRERGGPAVTPPANRGFGTTLLERSIAHQHKGRIDLDWRPDGLVCVIRMPLHEVVAGIATPSAGD